MRVGIPFNKIPIITILKVYAKMQDLQHTTPNMKQQLKYVSLCLVRNNFFARQKELVIGTSYPSFLTAI
jgi:hypothetical protein